MQAKNRRLGLPLFLGFAIVSSASSQDSELPSNRLSQESSPYLQLHAHNPVDWYPWGDEAIERAQREDKPIFLSIGYSTCYWCHVMEREVFSDPKIAALMNQWFVNIKVDREERPDLDDIYIVATQLLTQSSGGWPNSLFLTPQLEPFFAGTYFPPEDRGALPGFPNVISRVHRAWESERVEVEATAVRLAGIMNSIVADRSHTEVVPSPGDVALVVEPLKERFDTANGGFGEAPKFPSPAYLFLLWDRAGAAGDIEAGRMVLETLQKMGRGAIYDQLAGGFHRYTLDAQWRVPHFEKMLYDNALLAELLSATAHATGDRDLERLARGTLDFVLNNMQWPEGGFESAVDAETNGEEGAYYLWTRDQLRDALGADYELLAPILGFAGPPNFGGNRFTLYLTDTLSQHARQRGWTESELLARIEPPLERLRQARSQREPPLVDDKVLSDWNGMMIAALAQAGRWLDEPRYLQAARRSADFLLANLKDSNGKLLHAWRNGEAKIPAFLDDYAFFTRGLIALHEATGEARWLAEAERLAEEMEGRLRDAAGGYYMSEAGRHLLFQPKTIFDGAIPSGNGMAALALLRLSAHTGKIVYRQRAEATLKAFAGELVGRPESVVTLALVVDRYHRTAKEDLNARDAPLAEALIAADLLLQDSAEESEWRTFELRVTLREGWHVNANPASLPYLIPTEIRGPVRNVRYPRGENASFAFSDGPLSVYGNTFSIAGEIHRDASQLELRYQACDDRRCLPPADRSIRVPSD